MSDQDSPNRRASSRESHLSRSRSKSHSPSASRAASVGSGRSDRRKTGSRTRSPIRSAAHSRSRSSRKSSRRSRSRTRRRKPSSRSRSKSYSRRNRSRSRSRKKYYKSRSRSYSRSQPSRDFNSRSRSPLSNRRRHVGGRENPPTGRCLGIFGMSVYTRERDLKEVLSRYGRVESCKIVYDQTGRSRGFAFVYFENSEDAVVARERCNGIEVDGRQIRVDFSITQRAHTPTPGVYMGGPTSFGRYRGSGSPNYRQKRYSKSRSRSYSRSPRRY